MNTLRFRIEGLAPLLLHSSQLADPLNIFSKELKAVSGKRHKTDADFEEMARIEFLGSLYVNEDKHVVLPSKMVYAAIAGKGGAAGKSKERTTAKVALAVAGPFPLLYDGPQTPDGLWEDHRFRSREAVKVGQATVMRTRPIFEKWAADVEIGFDEAQANERQIRKWFEVAGALVGIGDWRPLYGRFSVV